MAWAKETAKGNSCRALTGERRRLSGMQAGCCMSIPKRAEALATLRRSSALQMRPYCFGSRSTASEGEQSQRPEQLNTGACLARITQCGISEANLIQDGWAASRQSGRLSTPAPNGDSLAPVFGGEIKQLASGVGCERKTSQTCRSIFTTLSVLPLKGCEPKYQISFCSARRAITSSTQGRM